MRRRGSLVLGILFLALLGWYLVYSQQIIRTLQADAATLTRMFSEVQEGMTDQDPFRATQALANLQSIIIESGVPLVMAGPGDTILAAENLPFDADLSTVEGQRRVRDYVTRLAVRNPPVGDPEVARMYFGDPPELQRLRWIPWLQVAGLLLLFTLGVGVVRAQRRAETDRAWTAMARELAHQLGTPISSLKGWLEVLRLDPDERPRELADSEVALEIGVDVERLERVSRRFELIGRDPRLDTVSVREVVESVDRYLRTRVPRRARGVTVRTEISDDLPELRGSPVLLSWALENLLKNSLDAMAGQGGEIVVRAFHREPGWLTLQVEDSGTGIEPHLRDRIFDPGVSSKSGGWGVGLSLTRRIVEHVHGGRIEVVRTGPEGSVFELRLPVAGSARPSRLPFLPLTKSGR
ncbi:MAG: sensor histidine kinase [Gemmatimonadales bacterium]|nr:MAG: sensor histidine kinase [Gemmatimonadales bacterium]